ncbi:hypothetical protein [Plesiocystis pacifica]|uniref:hypothetical protein n=1 Tax=Plesiocystis pacifica TaxID=191768 RepID=UPI0012FA9FFB|nr:hypothetical protein [Plesiocystis pacifica]
MKQLAPKPTALAGGLKAHLLQAADTGIKDSPKGAKCEVALAHAGLPDEEHLLHSTHDGRQVEHQDLRVEVSSSVRCTAGSDRLDPPCSKTLVRLHRLGLSNRVDGPTALNRSYRIK